MGFYDAQKLNQVRMPSLPASLQRNDGGAKILGKFTDQATTAFDDYRDRDIQENQDAAVVSALSQLGDTPIEQRANKAGDLFRQFNESNQTPRYALTPEIMKEQQGILNQETESALAAKQFAGYETPEEIFNRQQIGQTAQKAITIDANKDAAVKKVETDAEAARKLQEGKVALANLKLGNASKTETSEFNSRVANIMNMKEGMTREKAEIIALTKQSYAAYVGSFNDAVKAEDKKQVNLQEIQTALFDKDGKKTDLTKSLTDIEVENVLAGSKTKEDAVKNIKKTNQEKAKIAVDIFKGTNKSNTNLFADNLDWSGDGFISNSVQSRLTGIKDKSNVTQQSVTDYAQTDPVFAQKLLAILESDTDSDSFLHRGFLGLDIGADSKELQIADLVSKTKHFQNQ